MLLYRGINITAEPICNQLEKFSWKEAEQWDYICIYKSIICTYITRKLRYLETLQFLLIDAIVLFDREKW